MIESVHIKKFKCLKEIKVPLGPLTIIIGENDTGKSAFFEALHLFGKPGFEPLKEHFWRFDTSAFASVQTYDKYKSCLREYPSSISRLPSSGISMQCEGTDDSKGAPKLLDDGSNVSALIDFFMRKDRKRFSIFLDSIRSLLPWVEDIAISTPGDNQRRLDLIIEDGLTLPADNASVGVRMLIFFVALAFHPNPPKLVMVEEPENGIHPRRLGEVYNLLKALSKGKYGDTKAQVLISTHSPYLLDFANIKEDKILVFRRDVDGSVKASPIDDKKISVFLDEFKMGEVWFNEGEAGLLKIQTI